MDSLSQRIAQSSCRRSAGPTYCKLLDLSVHDRNSYCQCLFWPSSTFELLFLNMDESQIKIQPFFKIINPLNYDFVTNYFIQFQGSIRPKRGNNKIRFILSNKKQTNDGRWWWMITQDQARRKGGCVWAPPPLASKMVWCQFNIQYNEIYFLTGNICRQV